MMTNEFRTVQYRGTESQRNAYVGVPNGQQALDSNINYQNKQLQRSSEALLQQEEASIQNNKRLDALALDNQRLQLEQLNSRNNAVLKNQELFGQQRLNNMKLREDQAQQIRQLQLVHQQKSDELKLLNKRQENESITQFGAQMLQFSKTLWDQNVKQQQKKAQEMEAQAVIDYALNPNLGEMLRVDQAQYGRLAKQGEASALADALEKQGLPNDAARIRASNPFYLHTMQEMAAITSTKELPVYLNNVAQQAHADGSINYRDPDYSLKLQVIEYDALRKFLIEKGLSKMNPVVVARYLQGPMLDALAGVTKQFNAENNRQVKDATKSQALGDALASIHTFDDPVEVNKHVNQMYAQGGPEGLRELFAQVGAVSNMMQDRTAMVGLMQHPLMQQRFTGNYAEWNEQFNRRAETVLRQTQAEAYKNAVSEFKLQVSEANPADLPRLRQEALRKYEGSLSTEHYVQFMEMVQNTKAVDAGFMQTRVEDAISLGRGAIGNMLKNPNITTEQKAALEKAYNEANKLVMSEEHKQVLQHAKNLVLGRPATALKKSAQAMNPLFQKSVDAVIKQRQDELTLRAERFLINNPGASVADFRAYMSDQKDMIEAEINVDSFGRIPELGQGALTPDPSRPVPPNSRIQYKGRQVTFMLNENTRKAVMRGDYGWVDGGSTVLLTEAEIQAADAQFARTGIYPDYVYSLSTRTRSAHPTLFLESQARLHGGSGKASPPPSQSAGGTQTDVGKPGQPITRATAQRFALNAGLSHRGAIWLATNMIDESSGNPTAIHDGGDGYGLFGHQGGRLDNLKAYAASKGVDIRDGNMQIQFALQEIRTRYPEVWRTVTAPNPSLNDLWRASVAWEGFDEEVYNHRFNSLRTALGE